jgi:glycosyltransferase involved in cell wall biosynthesis
VEKELHILVLSSWYPTRMDPASGNFIQRFAEVLSTRFQVSVVFVRADAALKKTEIVETRRGNLHEIVVYYPKGSGLFGRVTQLARYKKALDQGLEKLHGKPDLIHAHVAFPKGKEFEYVSAKLGVDFILSAHSSDFSTEEREKWSKIKRRLVVQTLRKARLVLPVSAALEKDMLEVEPHFARIVLPLPVSTSLFYPAPKNHPQRPFTFLHVSSLDEKFKNVRGIVEAFHRVHQHHPQTKLVIATDGNPDDLIHFMESKGFSEGVEIKRNLSHEEVAIEYRISDCYVMFSHYETYSCVIVEALASGLQIISTDVGVVQSLDKRLITVVPPKDVHALATSMEEICMGKRHAEQSELVKAGKLFSDEHILDRLEMIYKEVLLQVND